MEGSITFSETSLVRVLSRSAEYFLHFQLVSGLLSPSSVLQSSFWVILTRFAGLNGGEIDLGAKLGFRGLFFLAAPPAPLVGVVAVPLALLVLCVASAPLLIPSCGAARPCAGAPQDDGLLSPWLPLGSRFDIFPQACREARQSAKRRCRAADDARRRHVVHAA